MAELAKKNLSVWADLHENLKKAWIPATQKPGKPDEEK